MAYKDRKSRKLFVETWKGRGYEKGETQQFWLSLLTNVLGYEHNDTVLFEHHVTTGGFIDVWIRQSDVMIEQKGIEVDLDKPELRQGELKTPLQQVQDYAASLPITEQPKYLITCNFGTFRVYDRTKYGDAELKNKAFEFQLEDLVDHPEYLSCIVDPNNSRLRKEKEVSEQAGALVGELYDMLLKQYDDPESDEAQHSLNVLCVRLVFCLFCEDAELFGEPDAFCNYLAGVRPVDIRIKLQHLFDNLDRPRESRDKYDIDIKAFPYVNGGLFREKVVIPPFTQEIKDFIIEKMALPVNWANISPTIFGGIFESTLNPDTRRKGGMHYTSPENIHKVIDPLFLNDLKTEFEAIRTDEELTLLKKKNRYKKFHEKLCSLVFFDPACGSGNFLTETYICLRQLEYAVLKEYKSKQVSVFDSAVEGDVELRIKLDQFYGIEINDFAVSVAETALWISRLKANREYLLLLDLDEKDFPLSDRANVIKENALRFDWHDLVEPSRVSYILGNPPFVGHKNVSEEQKEDMKRIFQGKQGRLDYVSAWYELTSHYIENTNIECSFVSTNTVVQGVHIETLWTKLLNEHIVINFAYKSFVWDSESNQKAHVHCVIIGFSKHERTTKLLFDGETVRAVDKITPYLSDSSTDVVVKSASSPLCNGIPKMVYGNIPRDGGYYTFTDEEKLEFLKKEPAAEQYMYRFLGSKEYINNSQRWMLFLKDVTSSELEKMPYVKERVENVKKFRLSSKAKEIHKFAETPTLFAQQTQPLGADFIIVPIVSSSRRRYIPIGYVSGNTLVNNRVFIIPNADFYTFGIVTSEMHNAWMRKVAVRLKNDYSYSKDLVYNNFPWPTPTVEQKAAIEKTAQGILDARALYPDSSLADLYDPDKMPNELKAAHEANDKAVMDAYGFAYDMTELEIVAELMKMYQKLTSKEQNI